MIDLTSIKEKTEELLKRKESSFVVFDADGTLWEQDVNNLLLNYQIENNLRDLKDLLRPIYEEEGHRKERCKEFVRRQAGFSPEDIKQQLREALKIRLLTIFSFQIELMRYFKKKGLKIFIVTASIKWLVEEIVKRENLPVDQVLGMQVRLNEGRLTDEFIPPLTYGEGKKEVFLEESGGKMPLFVAGNSPGDLFLLQIASIALVVNSAGQENEHFSGEQKMRKLAEEKGWFLMDLLKNPPQLKDFSNLEYRKNKRTFL